MLTLLEKQNAGLAGSATYLGATAVTGQDFCRVHCLTACTFTAFTDSLNSTDSALLNVSLAAGTILYGRITGFTASAGNLVRAYKSFAPTTIG